MDCHMMKSIILTCVLIITYIFWSCFFSANPISRPHIPVALTTVDPRPNGRCLSCFKWKYPVTISPRKDLCALQNGQEIDLIIIVPTKHENNQHRNLLREVFNSSLLEKHHIRVLFVFGKHPNAIREMEQSLQSEAKTHGDILQVDVFGSYRKMHLFTYNAYNWVTKFCSNARFVVKITDDAIFNVPGILNLLDIKGETELSDVLFGYCLSSAPVIQTKGHKWYMGAETYPFTDYPSYCSGAGFFFSVRLLKHFLLKEAENMAFPTDFDDVVVGINLRLTGHCVCGIPYLYLATSERHVKLAEMSSNENCTPLESAGPFLGIHLDGKTPDAMRRFWEKRHCYEPLILDNKTISDIKCRRQGECPQDFYPVRAISSL